MNILYKISKFIDNFNKKVGKLFSWLLLLMVLLTCLIVVLRYLFNIGFIWMQELVRFFYAAVFLICAAYTLVEDAHVRVDIFYSKLFRQLCHYDHTTLCLKKLDHNHLAIHLL